MVLLAVPAAASAKVGVELEKNPETLAPGENVTMNVMLFREPRKPGGDLQPVVGRSPLITFENVKTGEVVRVRASRTGAEGMATAEVSFPSRGEWTVDLGDIPGVLDEGTQSLPVGVPFGSTAAGRSLPMEEYPPPPRPAAPEPGSSFPALPLGVGLGFAMVAAAAVLLLRRRQEGAA